jgi:RNA polymerase sigma factor (sigma-70 family)
VLEGLLARDPDDRMTAATALRLLDEIADAAEVTDPEALYRAYAKPLRRYVRCLVADRRLSEGLVDTDGVVQEAFLRLLTTTKPIRNPAAWLFVVARNEVGRAAARQHRASDLVGDLDASVARWSSLALRPQLEDILTARAIMDAIADLPDKQRIATYLHLVQGWSQTEIGDYGKFAAKTAGVHIHRGTKHVRDTVPRYDSVARAVRDMVLAQTPARPRSLRDLLRVLGLAAPSSAKTTISITAA